MDIPLSRHIPLPGTLNVRDLGGYETVDGNTTRWRRMLRADTLHRLDEEGVARLLSEGVVAVIDLRHDSELAEAPNPFSRLEGFQYVNINLFADLMPTTDAVHDGERDILLDLYLRALAERSTVIRQFIETVAEFPVGGVVFHCTAGKDRTGILAALLLTIAGVGRADVVEDYALTETHLKPAIPDFEQRARERGQDLGSLRAMLRSRRETMQAMLDHLDDNHGGPIAYLSSIGVSELTLRRVRDRIVNDQQL